MKNNCNHWVDVTPQGDFYCPECQLMLSEKHASDILSQFLGYKAVKYMIEVFRIKIKLIKDVSYTKEQARNKVQELMANYLIE